ncbi:MAG: delta(1)-pyrroline-2-carboxylate reductase family protein [Meiothermus sp.]|uniref:delta(1)-pyrroline-2-carboxylate reductase family protein n=1 Tax=Meiothermus sp. TaxID=1955249 RepID=UPI0025E269E2|nr:delta(1)-pyrroline-2-carboxylate reductase family protein [Meiothermus sp.]MCS7067948.1 delta(1)-pyrroline-2-carboxylate reductase family protein [Meiothermus sp.]MCX7600876.1 delta(1)-pyrroline-2-carboxylate reductase family protein [Meiothermus sp.]MDW8424871.1 delta(1)-pyrroline-2-carboxylate reductase family protein [Meiothermus sp.]
MRILSAEETAALLPYPALAKSVVEVLADHARGQTVAPERLVVPLPGGATLLLMPAADPSITVTKVVTVHPQQHPSVRAEVWMMRTQTGERLALLEGSVVTARRTAAVSLLAAQTLAAHPSGPLLIIGAGTQGQSHLEAFQEGLGTDKVYVYSRSLERAEALASYARQRRMLAQAVRHLEPALDEASLIVCATTSPTPVLFKAAPEAFIAAVGAYRPEMAEVAPEVVRQAHIFVDTLEGARAEAGDLLQAGVDWGQVQPLEAALHQPRPSSGIVLFKSVGHALWDLAAARLAAQALGC